MDHQPELSFPQREAEPVTITAKASTFPVEIWTDGSCSGNPGPGGWAAVVRRADGAELEVWGRNPDTTNNRMELTAAIRALRSLTGNRKVILRSDSKTLVQGVTEWIDGWQARGWRSAQGKFVANADLWLELLEAATPHEVTWEWVRGHAGDTMNVRVDRLAENSRNGRRKDGHRMIAPKGTGGAAS